MIIKITLTENNYLFLTKNKWLKSSILFEDGEFILKNKSELFIYYFFLLHYPYEYENVKVIAEEEFTRKIYIDVPQKKMPEQLFYGKRSIFDLANVSFNEYIRSKLMEDFVQIFDLYRMKGFSKSESVLRFMKIYNFDNSQNQKEIFLNYYRHYRKQNPFEYLPLRKVSEDEITD